MSFGDILALIRTGLDVIRFMNDKEKRQQLKNDLTRVNETVKPYIINRFVFRAVLFLDIVIYILGTALCIFYCDAIADSHNIFIALFVSLALMAANINLLYRAALAYRSFQRSLA